MVQNWKEVAPGRYRETFGRYVDPRVVEGLIARQSPTAADGERRVMTVLFCDMKGFTSLSEGMTPQGLVKVMNHYLSTMSGPIRGHRGIIDKYIGDAIMAYWGPPFTEHAEQARLACLAAVEMADRGKALRTELPELLGVRTVPSDCEVRIGIATGEESNLTVLDVDGDVGVEELGKLAGGAGVLSAFSNTLVVVTSGVIVGWCI